MPAFRDPGAARAYVDSVFRAGGFLPGRKAPGDWSDAYTLRLANVWQRQTAAGQPITRQAARGHAPRLVAGRGGRPDRYVSTEHPRQFTVSRAGGQYRVIPTHGTETLPAGLQQREYRDPGAMLRWMHGRLPAGVGVQVVAFGEPVLEYLDDEARQEWQAAEANGLPLPTAEPEWLTIYTGDTSGEADENGARMRDLADLRSAEQRVFVAGSVEQYILRWGDRA